MPNCRYVVLSYHPTEDSKKGRPLVLLLEYAAEDGSRQRKSYLLCDLARLVDDLSPPIHEWIISVLNDLNRGQSQPHLNTDEMFGWYSFLDVGPLRTTCFGSFDCGSLSQAFASIKEDVLSSPWNSNEGGCFPDFLLPLDRVTLRKSRVAIEGGPQSRSRKSS
jgi:hypothetical protein